MRSLKKAAESSHREHAMANQYDISISPDTVAMSLTEVFTVTVTNLGTSDERRARAKGALDDPPSLTNSVVIGIPYGNSDTDLPPSLGDGNCTPITPGWNCGRRTTSSGVVFVFWPSKGTKFDVGTQAQMTLPSFVISTVASGPSTIQTLTTLGGVDENQDITVTKVLPPLAVQNFTATPLTVGAQQRTTLAWQVTGASQVQITPGVGTFPAPNKFLWNSSTTALPSQTRGESTFQAIATTGDQREASQPITVYLSPPTASLSLSTNGPIDASDAQGNWTTVIASWATQYATTANLSDGSSNPRVPLQCPSYPLTPGASLIGNGNAVSETLTASGFPPPAKSSQTITFNPARILYFKYANPDLTGIMFQALGSTNGGGAITQPVSGGPFIFTVTGPGGPLVQYLGKNDTRTQVMYFNANPPSVASGGTVTLSWITNNATSLLLQPGSVSLTVVPNFGVGTTTVNPTATTNYVLTATGPNGTVTSTLTVTVSA
jgi:hypothetical protein